VTTPTIQTPVQAPSRMKFDLAPPGRLPLRQNSLPVVGEREHVFNKSNPAVSRHKELNNLSVAIRLGLSHGLALRVGQNRVQ